MSPHLEHATSCAGALGMQAIGRHPPGRYLPAARRCQRVRFSIFLCFFLRIRLRRFLTRDPMRSPKLERAPIVLQPGGRAPTAI